MKKTVALILAFLIALFAARGGFRKSPDTDTKDAEIPLPMAEPKKKPDIQEYTR